MTKLHAMIVLAGISAFANGCMTTPPPAPAPYHATGTEPFWNLLVDEHDVTFTTPDTQPIRQPTPRAIIGVAGKTYQTPRINLNIVHARCSDGMSNRVYPDTVQVTVDGRSLKGCGGL